MAMTRCNRGFLLVSLCVYLAFFMLLLVLSMQLMGPGIISSFSRTNGCQSLLDLHSASDLFLRDLWQAPADISAWHVHTDSLLIWNSGKKTVGWSTADATIKRMEGLYEPASGAWRDLIQSVVLKNAHGIFRSSHDTNHMKSIALHITKNNHSVQTFWCFYGR
jgi:hypothetical protein